MLLQRVLNSFRLTQNKSIFFLQNRNHLIRKMSLTREFNVSKSETVAEPLIDVLDEFGIRTGESLTREQIHKLGKIHRAVHLYLFDESNNLLLQRRSNKTDHYPGMLSISLTGHVDAGEHSMAALKREIKEELNFDASLMKIEFLFSFRQDAFLSTSYTDRQFNDVYACWHKFKVDDILFDSNDISDVKLVSFLEFKTMVESEESELAPVYKKECADIVHFLRNQLKA